jgi:C-terminal processing protease CtpA/Prc
MILSIAILFSLTLIACQTLTTTHSETTNHSSSDTIGTTTVSSSETSSLSTTTLDDGTFSLAAVTNDFNLLISYLELNPKVFTDWDETLAIIAEQRSLLKDGMTLLEFYRVVTPIVVSMKCGHTGIDLPASFLDERITDEALNPIKVVYMEDKIRVLSSEDPDIGSGDEILAVNGTSTADLIESMMEFIGSDGDNTTHKIAIIRMLFWYFYEIFIADESDLIIDYYDYDLQIERSKVVGIVEFSMIGWEEQVPFQATYEDDYAILKLSSFYPYGVYTLNSFFDFYETFFTQVSNLGIEKIILDIRINGGGDPRVTSRLFSYLAKSEQPYFRADSPDYYSGLKNDIAFSDPHFDGTIVTLIGGMCFSSCGHFAALMDFQNVGFFVGEETGGSFVCSDSSTYMRLPRTKLELTTSTQLWAVATTGLTLGRGIMPDHPVQQTFDDYLLDIDTVLEYAIALLTNIE